MTENIGREDDCCHSSDSSEKENSKPIVSICPSCTIKGKVVQLITLKSLLKPSALKNLNPQLVYSFCKNPECITVYFAGKQQYFVDDLKVNIYQKTQAINTPVCYCFDWTEESIAMAFEDNSYKEIPISITEHISKGRCGCEVNNPQGSCCLGNINKVITSYEVILKGK